MKPLIVAHRGDSKYYPENTKSAFESAMKKGADILEVDVRETKDGELVCLHDPFIDRVIDWEYSGFVREIESELFKKAEVINPYTGKKDKVLFLDEFLEITKGNAIMIEIKEPYIEHKVIEKVEGCGREEETFISSFVRGILDRVWIAKPSLKRIAIYSFLPKNFYYQIYSRQHTGLAVSYPFLKLIIDEEKEMAEHLKELRESGKIVGVYTVNDEDRMREVSGYVDMIVTDDPGLAKKVLS